MIRSNKPGQVADVLGDHHRAGSLRLGRSYQVSFGAMFSDQRDLDNVRRTGSSLNVEFRAQGRNLSYSVGHNEIDPDFGTELGFIRRVDQKQTSANIS